MSPQHVKAKEILSDIAAGVTLDGLRRKYHLSEIALENVLRELNAKGLLKDFSHLLEVPPKIRISTREIVSDILSGMGSSELKKKFGLTPFGLKTVLTKLVKAQALAPDQFGEELLLRYEAASPDNVRWEKRYYLDFEVSVFEEEDPETIGRVRDISHKGIGVDGLHVNVEDVKNLVISPHGLPDSSPISFRARCHWARKDPASALTLSGYEIVKIGKADERAFSRLILAVTFGG